LTDLASVLAAGARDLGLSLSVDQSRQLLDLLAELADWNTRFNLTAIDDPAEGVRKHLLDSLSINAHVQGRHVADVGSGAGFPGLPLAIADPTRKITLIEATGKKAQFLEHARTKLGLDNVRVVNSRAEQFKPAARFDAVIARALGKLAEFIRVAGHLAAPAGRLLAMKGQYPEAELQDLPKGWQATAVARLIVPGLDAQRHLVELQRTAGERRPRKPH
jgi:16S rRNA (guanine527-N7)-methyltransferase